MILFTPQQIHFILVHSTLLSPTSQSDPPDFVATDTLFTRASALPRQLPRLLTGLARVTALTPICNQSAVDLTLPSQTDMSHSLRFEILHYVPTYKPLSLLAWHSAPRLPDFRAISHIFHYPFQLSFPHSTTEPFLWKGLMCFCF